MTRHTARKAVVVAAAVAGLMMSGAGTAAAHGGDDDFDFDDRGRLVDRGFFFDDRVFVDRSFACVGPFCFVVDGPGGPGPG